MNSTCVPVIHFRDTSSLGVIHSMSWLFVQGKCFYILQRVVYSINTIITLHTSIFSHFFAVVGLGLSINGEIIYTVQTGDDDLEFFFFFSVFLYIRMFTGLVII